MIRIEDRVVLTGGVCDARRLAFQIGEQMARNPPTDTHGKRQAVELFSGLPSRYDRLSSWLSFGQDPRWRRALVTALAPAPGARVLDVATGTGMVTAEMLAAARARFAGDRRVELMQGEAEALPFADETFDLLTFTYLLRYVEDPAATLRELARVVRPGGRVSSLEFGVPPWLPARVAWRFYTAVGLPTLGRIASREWMEVGRFLGPSIRGYYARHPLDQIVGYWREAGFEHVTVRRMSLGGGVVMSASKAAGRSDASGA
jgi:demethylmenaquinone methyltransferase / 2-methoxy-6-polyprenyl-1,4-benzoquinol methylase